VQLLLDFVQKRGRGWFCVSVCVMGAMACFVWTYGAPLILVIWMHATGSSRRNLTSASFSGKGRRTGGTRDRSPTTRKQPQFGEFAKKGSRNLGGGRDSRRVARTGYVAWLVHQGPCPFKPDWSVAPRRFSLQVSGDLVLPSEVPVDRRLHSTALHKPHW